MNSGGNTTLGVKLALFPSPQNPRAAEWGGVLALGLSLVEISLSFLSQQGQGQRLAQRCLILGQNCLILCHIHRISRWIYEQTLSFPSLCAQNFRGKATKCPWTPSPGCSLHPSDFCSVFSAAHGNWCQLVPISVRLRAKSLMSFRQGGNCWGLCQRVPGLALLWVSGKWGNCREQLGKC